MILSRCSVDILSRVYVLMLQIVSVLNHTSRHALHPKNMLYTTSMLLMYCYTTRRLLLIDIMR